jgi:hypothetical protein
VLLLPDSAELPFPDGLDLEGEAGFWRMWKAQLVLRGLPAMGPPRLTVSTNLDRLHPGRRTDRRRSLPVRSVFAHGQGDRGSRHARRPDRSGDGPGEGRDAIGENCLSLPRCFACGKTAATAACAYRSADHPENAL